MQRQGRATTTFTTTLTTTMVSLVLGIPGVAVSAQCDQTDTLVADPGAPNEIFGIDVALNDDRVLVGAPGNNQNPAAPGAAYVYAREGVSWEFEQELIAADGEAGDRFGWSVSIDGSVMVIGARQDGDLGDDSGSAYVFRFDGSNWTQEQKLLASDGAAFRHFGDSVAIDGDVVLVGAASANAMYIFRYDGANWNEEQKLVPPPGANTTRLGNSVSIDGDVIVGGGTDVDWDTGTWWGSAHVFRYDGNNAWVHEQHLLVPAVQAAGFFGAPVALSGEIAIVGAWLDPAQCAGCGSAVLFRYDGAAWVLEQTVYAPDAQSNDVFGCDVSIDGDRAIVGSRGNDSGGNGAGAAFVFHYDGAAWVQVQELLATGGADQDLFGGSVAIANGVALAGAPGADPAGDGSGAAYVFTCETTCPADVTGDGVVGFADVLDVLASWGNCVACEADVDGDGLVGFLDLLVVLGAWGDC